MKKKIAVRKLNRTLLKKEGTKEVYITGKNVLMPFFDYKSIDDLASSRREDSAKRLFLYKKKLDESTTLCVTKENNEVRLTGFDDFFVVNDVNEVDQIIIESVNRNGENTYLLDYIKCFSTRVLQSYEPKDNSANYSINIVKKEVKSANGTISERDAIQVEEINPPKEKYENMYWLWDDSFNPERWGELLDREIQVVFIAKGDVIHKTVKIIKTENSFKKIMKARTNSSNKLEAQEKELYMIQEKVGDEWCIADFKGIRNLELVDEGNRIKISNRDAMSFWMSEGGEV